MRDTQTLAKNIIDMIYEEAKKQGLKQSTIAKRSRTSDAYLSHLANKVSSGEGISTKTIEKLAQAVGCRIEIKLIPYGLLRALRIDKLEKELAELRQENE